MVPRSLGALLPLLLQNVVAAMAAVHPDGGKYYGGLKISHVRHVVPTLPALDRRSLWLFGIWHAPFYAARAFVR